MQLPCLHALYHCKELTGPIPQLVECSCSWAHCAYRAGQANSGNKHRLLSRTQITLTLQGRIMITHSGVAGEVRKSRTAACSQIQSNIKKPSLSKLLVMLPQASGR